MTHSHGGAQGCGGQQDAGLLLAIPAGKDTEVESCGGYSLGATFHFRDPYL